VIDADFAELIFDDRDALAMLLGKNTVDERGLARSEEAVSTVTGTRALIACLARPPAIGRAGMRSTDSSTAIQARCCGNRYGRTAAKNGVPASRCTCRLRQTRSSCSSRDCSPTCRALNAGARSNSRTSCSFAAAPSVA